jgi:hypothetical protein
MRKFAIAGFVTVAMSLPFLGGTVESYVRSWFRGARTRSCRPVPAGPSNWLSGGSSFDLLTQVPRELFVFHCALMLSRAFSNNPPPERRIKKSPGIRAQAELGSSVTPSPTQSGSIRFEKRSQRVVAEYLSRIRA